MFRFSLDEMGWNENTPWSSAPSTHQAANYRKTLRPKIRKLSKNFDMYLRRHNHSIYGISHNWSPIIPRFDLDVVYSLRTSQSSQVSNWMPSPKTDVASNQSSQLAQPSYFSNPALMDSSNLPSLHLDTNSPLPQGVAGGVKNHPLLRLSPPPLPPHINAHALIYMLQTFYLPLPLHPPPLMTCLTFVQ